MTMPHCDSNVLHGPGTCRYCDYYPDAQRARITAGINFTGEHDPSKSTCPAEQARPIHVLERWGGNRPETRSVEQMDADAAGYWAEVDRYLAESEGVSIEQAARLRSETGLGPEPAQKLPRVE